ncbi:hypothetical protein IJ531_01120 [bacterium]|nr:hypothetical protein [bacterium]
MLKPRPKTAATAPQAVNPFLKQDNSEALMKSLASIDSRDIRCKFKNTEDPITLAFQTIEETSLKSLAKDFVKESFYDFISFVGDICK